DGRRAVRSPSGASYPQSGGSPNPLILYGTPARHGRVFIASLLSCRAGLAAYAVGPPMLPWPRKACASTPPRPAGSLQYRQNHSSATFKHYKYVYDYDRMGRLLGVDFRRSEQGGWTNASTFDVSELSYDANGNLLKLKRRPNTGGYIDNLSFAYTSGTNKLNILTDAAGAQASWDASTMLYAYDQRGNVTYREDFGRSHIDYLTYDELNRLTEFKRMGAVPFTTAYRYSAGGERYWKKTAGQTGEYYVLEGSETVGVFREDGSY